MTYKKLFRLDFGFTLNLCLCLIFGFDFVFEFLSDFRFRTSALFCSIASCIIFSYLLLLVIMRANNKSSVLSFLFSQSAFVALMLAIVIGASMYFSQQAEQDTYTGTSAQNAGIVIVAAGDWDDKFGASGATQRTLTTAVQA